METEWLTAIVRAVHLAAMLSLLGSLAFSTWLLPGLSPGAFPVLPLASSFSPPIRLCRTLRRIILASGVLSLLGGGAWLALTAAAMADAWTWPALSQALPVVMAHTRFGQILDTRLLLLLLGLALAAGHRPGLALLPAAAAAALQGLIGHAGAMGNTQLLVSEALHLLAAGLWLGALLPLWLSIRAMPVALAAPLCESFTPLGLGCVLVLAGTGLAQADVLIGGVRPLLDTPYGRIAMLKLALFLVALSLAACNRLWLTDRLVQGVTRTRRHLLASVAVEAAIGLAVIIAAAFLASTMPATSQAMGAPS
jgi:copper resistance protein D